VPAKDVLGEALAMPGFPLGLAAMPCGEVAHALNAAAKAATIIRCSTFDSSRVRELRRLDTVVAAMVGVLVR
jgi:hypothetical protein